MSAMKKHLTPLEARLIAKLIGRLEQVEGVTAIILYGSRAGGKDLKLIKHHVKPALLVTKLGLDDKKLSNRRQNREY